MRRDDTTTEEYQRSFRGRHRVPGTGVWSYPSTRADAGRFSAGTRYLRCPCGWRLVEVSRRQMDDAKAEWVRHVDEVRRYAERGQQTGH